MTLTCSELKCIQRFREGKENTFAPLRDTNGMAKYMKGFVNR